MDVASPTSNFPMRKPNPICLLEIWWGLFSTAQGPTGPSLTTMTLSSSQLSVQWGADFGQMRRQQFCLLGRDNKLTTRRTFLQIGQPTSLFSLGAAVVIKNNQNAGWVFEHNGFYGGGYAYYIDQAYDSDAQFIGDEFSANYVDGSEGEANFNGSRCMCDFHQPLQFRQPFSRPPAESNLQFLHSHRTALRCGKRRACWKRPHRVVRFSRRGLQRAGEDFFSTHHHQLRKRICSPYL